MKRSILIGVFALFMANNLIAFGPGNMFNNLLGGNKKFNCSSESFVSFNTEALTSSGDSKYDTISLTDGSRSATQIVNGVNGVNSIGYNVKDNLIWGYNLGSNKIVKIDANKKATTYNVAGLDERFYVAADVDQNGVLYLFSRETSVEQMKITRVDVTTQTPTLLSDLTLTGAINTADIAFNPKDKKLYFIENATDKLYKITISGNSGQVELVGDLFPNSIESVNPIIVFFDKDGNFYFNKDTTNMYKVNLSSSTFDSATWFSGLDNALSNGDGARCANAPMDTSDSLTVKIDDANVTEGDSGISKLRFKFTYSTPQEVGKEIRCSISDGTAINGEDYNITSNFLVEGTSGESFFVEVDVIGDTIVESDENLTLECSSSEVEFTKSKAVGVIINDDDNRFECNSNSYIFSSDKDANYAKSEIINLLDGNITTAKESFGTYHINAIGFNPVDGYIYGWQAGEGDISNDYIKPDAHLVKIDANYNVYDVNLKSQLPNSQKRFFLGDVSKDGIYYMANMESNNSSYSLSKIRVIDLNNNTPLDDITINYPANATFITNADFAINPIDDNLYMVNANNNQLIRITLNGANKGEYEELGQVYPLGADKNTYSVFDFFDKYGNFYFQMGSKIYKIDISNPWTGIDNNKARAIPFSNIGLNTSGDGARCALASVGNKPTIVIEDTSVVEGDDGQRDMVFEVKILNNEEPSSLTVRYQILDGNFTNSKLNARNGEDYISRGVPETRVFELASDFNISIPIKGDRKIEADEKLLLKLSIESGDYKSESLDDIVAVGTIIDDDRPNGKCFATTDNYDKLFIYDDLNEIDGLASPRELNISEVVDGEGGSYRAVDGNMYVFSHKITNTDGSGYGLKKIDLNSGEVTTVEEFSFDSNDIHPDAAEFYYDPDTKNEIFYVVDKHGPNKEGSIFYEIDPANDWNISSSKPIVDSEGVSKKIGALAVDPYSGELYGVLDAGGLSGDSEDAPILYRLKLESNKVVATQIFQLPRVDAEGLAFSNDGKLYLETEETGSEDMEHKIYRVDFYNKTLTAVSNSGTKDKDSLDKDRNKYVDIETLSCNGGNYQVPPKFTIMQKEIDITEGNPTNGLSELTPEKISVVVRANRAIRENEDDVMFVAYIQQEEKNRGTATIDEDYIQYDLNKPSFFMRVGESELNISKALVMSDFVVEYDEYFNITLKSSIGSFEDGENLVKVNIIDDDFSTFTAYDYDDITANIEDKKIKTKIANEQFVVTLDNINNPDKVEDVNRSTTRVKIVEHLECDKSLDELNVSSYSLFDMPEGEFDVDVGFTINKAIKDARVMFVWSDRRGDAHTSCSADHFAIRPDSFSFNNIGPSSLEKAVAGKPYSLKIDAITEDYRVVGYDEINNDSFKIDANQSQIDKCSYDDSDFDDSNMTQFLDGLLDGTIKYGNVGKLRINISEIKGSEFAKVDENDTDWSDRQISEKNTTIEFVPDHFKVDVEFENRHTDDGYAFYSNDIANSPKWTITALAVDENENVLKNYNSECLGGKSIDLNITLDVNASDDLKLISNIDSEKDVTPDSSVTLDSNISDFEEGKGTTDVKINFKRGVLPLDPSKVTMDQVSVKDGLTTGLSIKPADSFVQYQYMRAYIQDPISVIGTKEITTKVYYETFESSSHKVSAKKGVRSKSGERSWYKVQTFDNKSGKMSYSDNNETKYGSADRVTIAKVDEKTVKITAKDLPEKNVVYLDVKDEFKTSVSAKISTHVSFMPDTANWAGEGETGMIVDTNISRKSIFKKMSW